MDNLMTAHPGPNSDVKVLSAKELSDRVKEIHDLVAKRAYDLYQHDGRPEGHAAANWTRAEADMIFKVPVGLMISADVLSLYIGACGACARDFEIAVEPRRLVITGRVPVRSAVASRGSKARMNVLRVIDLPVEVDPSKIRTKLRNGLLQIDLATCASVGRETQPRAA